MAESEATIVRNLVREFQLLAEASRRAGNNNANLIPQFEALANQLFPYSDTFIEASSAIVEIRNYVRLIEQKSVTNDTRNSAGDIVGESQRARDDGASVQNPGPAQVVIVPESRINIATEVGTNDPVRTLTQTQATPPTPINNTFDIEDGGFSGVPTVTASGQTPGNGARSDDSPAPSSGGAQSVINAAFSTPANARIQSRPNILDQYASYTYAISWYLLTPDQYNTMQTTQRRDCSGWQLLMQSGGAPTQSAAGFAGRNQYFDLDYYIDDLEIDSLVPLKGTRMAHSAVDLRFKVVEPNGVTLINNLYRAVDSLYKSASVNNGGTTTTTATPNYPMAQYCLVIRFYGYDDAGNLVTPVKGDNQAVVEKFYPFVITNIRFRMANRAVEYEVAGKPMGQFYNLSQDRGTIPFQFTLIGETVQEVLVGKPVGTQYPRDDGRTDSPQPNAGSLATASVNDISASAGVDANGNFTGETASPFTVAGA